MTNQVDKLLAEVKGLQAACEHHSFVVSREPVLEPSEVEGVYVGYDAQNYLGGFVTFLLQCRDCSLKVNSTITKRCPQCLSDMKEGALEDRKSYFGANHIYYKARKYRCSKCSFSVVADEWDQ